VVYIQSLYIWVQMSKIQTTGARCLTSLSESAVLQPRSPQIVDTDGSQEIQEHTGSPARFRPPQPAKRARNRNKPQVRWIASRSTPVPLPPIISRTAKELFFLIVSLLIKKKRSLACEPPKLQSAHIGTWCRLAPPIVLLSVAAATRHPLRRAPVHARNAISRQASLMVTGKEPSEAVDSTVY